MSAAGVTGARADVVVVGNGPAGLAVTAACAESGLAVTVLAEDHSRRWPQTFGVWAGELERLQLASVLADRWPAVQVRLDESGPRRLARAYGRIDNDRLRSLLLTRAERAGARLLTGRAVAAEHDASGTTVLTDAGQRLMCRITVDASGHRPALVRAGRGRPPAYQAAYGLVGRFSHSPLPTGTMVLMDYRDPPGAPMDQAVGHPTFLYAMDLGQGRQLFEETSLARRPALDQRSLQARLERRLTSLGVRLEERVGIERVHIPMGGPLPRRDEPVVGFGAAAGMVHPATGYQVGAALARAPMLATGLVDALDSSHASPTTVAAAGWRAVWPDDLLRQRALHLLGLEALLRFDPRSTRQFFRAFFDLPEHRWSGFLSGEESAGALASTMLSLFARVPAGVRGILAATAARHPGLLRDAVRPGQ
ncbi:MAG TPA: lycopene cyclase family protein [Egibacteraceae bacterium]|nr:lycopene cyclase family protein [Egibacteraceae bacterium]